MEKQPSPMEHLKQHDKLPIRIVAPGFGHLTPAEPAKQPKAYRVPYYFLLFMLDGCTRHMVDVQEYEVGCNELLFILPHQVHEQPLLNHGNDYFKIGFDESCLALLPTQCPFLVDPLNSPKVRFTGGAAARLRSIFMMLKELLGHRNTPAELVLAHLNSLLTEINMAYFAERRKVSNEKISTFIGFKIFVENNFTDHPAISHIAEQLATNTNGLYHIVKQYSGLSPKEFITNRLILEARRRLYYSQSASIKDLAFGLGFNDPDYFARLFKKVTGRTITCFIGDLSGK